MELVAFVQKHSITVVCVRLIPRSRQHIRVYAGLREFVANPMGRALQDVLLSQVGQESNAVTEEEIQHLLSAYALYSYWLRFGDPYVVEEMFASSPTLKRARFDMLLPSQSLDLCWMAARKRGGEVVVSEVPRKMLFDFQLT